MGYKLHVITSLLASLAGAQVGNSIYKIRLTGEDLATSSRWSVAGTDLGIPYVLENGISVGYLFGDTFSTQWPDDGQGWRSPVMLRSTTPPSDPGGIVFDSAAGVAGDGYAPEICHNGHNGDDGTTGAWEFTVIPNDGIGFPETGDQVVSYMSIADWTPPWRTNYAGLAHSADGNTFTRLPGAVWPNDAANTDPFQMWTVQRDGDYVYVFSVRSGRQFGPMMLRRVAWDRMADPAAYEGWGWDAAGADWAWGRPCTPIFEGTFGEPSVRRLGDGTWAMTYLQLDGELPQIVSRTATRPDGVWSAETVQVTWQQETSLYGGFIHPWSTAAEGDLHLLVSKWTTDPATGRSTAYHVSQYEGTL